MTTFKTNLGKEVSPSVVFVVDEHESERGWGRNLLTQHFFLTEEDSEKFIRKYNERNNLNYVPDYYTSCSFNGRYPISDLAKLKREIVIIESLEELDLFKKDRQLELDEESYQDFDPS